ncbi:MAG: hypothetical protein LCH93_13840 [Proteobacteria bacterium]|nr:hypothetical protein [Pseudomonadota bacterium]
MPAFTTASLIAFGIKMAASAILSIGARMIMSLFTPQQSSHGGELPTAKDPGTTLTLRRPAEPKNIVFGTTRVQGNIIFAHCTHDNYMLHLVIEWAGWKVSGYGELYFNDEIVPLLGGLATGKYASLVGVNDYFGDDDQLANSNLIGYAPDKWTAAHRGRGVAYSYINLVWDAAKFPQGLPNIWRVVRGMPMFDPRTGTTAYSENAALAIAAWLNNKRFGRGIPYAEMNLERLEIAANICDELVTLANGSTEKRYTCNGVLTADTPFVDNLEKVLSASLGRTHFVGGEWQIDASAWKEPEFPPFELKDFRDGFSVQTLLPKSEAFNAVKGSFRNPARLWQKDDFPAITSAAYEAEDGGDREFKDTYLEMTNSATMAQRLARIDLRRARQPLSFVAPMKLRGLRAQVGDVESFTIPQLGWVAKPFEVVSTSMVLGYAPGDDGGQQGIIGIDLSLRETAEFIYARTTDEEQLLDPAPNTNLPNLFNPLPPSNLVVTEDLYETRGSAGVKARATLAWQASPDAFVERYLPMYRVSGTTEWIKRPIVEGLNTTIDDIEPGQWEFAIAGVNRARVKSPIVTYAVEIKGLLAKPAAPTGVSGRVLASIVLAEWNPAPDADLDVRIGGQMIVRHSPILVGATWETASQVGFFSGSSGGGVMPALAGTYLFKWRDSSKQLSETAASWVVEHVSTGEWSLLEQRVEQPLFTGAKTNCSVVSSKLSLNVGQTAGSYAFSSVVDLAAAYAVKVTGVVDASVTLASNLWDSAELVDSPELWDGQFSGTEASAVLMMRKTNDDPGGSPTWTAWTPLTVSELSGRAFQFRLDLASINTDYGIEIQELAIAIETRA